MLNNVHPVHSEPVRAPVVVKPLPTLYSQVALLEILLEVLARLTRDVSSRVSVVLLNIVHHVQTDYIHLLKGALGCLQHAPKDGVNLLRRPRSLRRRQQGFPLDSCPYPRDPVTKDGRSSVEKEYLPIVEISHRLATHMKRVKPVCRALRQHQFYVAGVRSLVSHDLNC